MNPNLAPPAPPPLQPITPSNNPYDFITQPPSSKKRGLLGGANTKQRIIVAVGALFILSVLAAVVIGFLGSSSSGLKADYVSVAQQQAELIRVSEIGVTKARSSETKNLAVNTKLSLLSEQPALLQLAKKAGAQTDIKSLSVGKNLQTDAALTSAAQTNQFDSVFIKTMETGLKKYQETLKKIYDQTPQPSAQDVLSKTYKNAETLLSTLPKQ